MCREVLRDVMKMLRPLVLNIESSVPAPRCSVNLRIFPSYLYISVEGGEVKKKKKEHGMNFLDVTGVRMETHGLNSKNWKNNAIELPLGALTNSMRRACTNPTMTIRITVN